MNIFRNQFLPAVSALLLIVLSGCATSPPRSVAGAQKDLLDFMHSGVTTREEVLLKLGQPSGSFQQEEILTYRLMGDARHGYRLVTKSPEPLGWLWVRYNLVLTFNPNGILEKQNLVSIQ
jgi:hypothetical protein